jgi:ABC-2 type transport system permease protein
VTSFERVGQRAGWADLPAGPLAAVGETMAIVEVELRKLRHDPVELVTRAVQPILWLLVFGQVIARARLIGTGTVPYLDFLAPGVLAQSALFTAIFFGIAVIWERDLGIVHKYLVSPASRISLVLGKGLAGGLRALVQSVLIYAVAAALGVHLDLNPLHLAGVAVAIVLGAMAFSVLSLAIACLVRTRERFMGIGQVVTMPLFFASSAVYPIALMPSWLQLLAHLNPLTYQVDALRGLMVVGAGTTYPLPLDLGVLLATGVILVAVTARLYPRVVL